MFRMANLPHLLSAEKISPKGPPHFSQALINGFALFEKGSNTFFGILRST